MFVVVHRQPSRLYVDEDEPMAVRKLRPRRANLRKLRPRLKLNGKPNETPRGGRRWTAWARSFRRANPICQRCQLGLSDEVHHVVPVSEAPERTFDVSNVVALCRRCHRLVHAGQPLGVTMPDPEGA